MFSYYIIPNPSPLLRVLSSKHCLHFATKHQPHCEPLLSHSLSTDSFAQISGTALQCFDSSSDGDSKGVDTALAPLGSPWA